MNEKYIINELTTILGRKKYLEFSEKLFHRVNERFNGISVEEALRYVRYNKKLVLVIGSEISNGCRKEELEKRLQKYKLNEKSLMIEKNIYDMIKIYNEYIKIIINYINKKSKKI